jgi:hypothetical protein
MEAVRAAFREAPIHQPDDLPRVRRSGVVDQIKPQRTRIWVSINQVIECYSNAARLSGYRSERPAALDYSARNAFKVSHVLDCLQ